MKWTHFAIFVAQFLGTFHFSKEMSINRSVTKKLFFFLTVPLYWLVVIDAYETLRQANLNVLSATTD